MDIQKASSNVIPPPQTTFSRAATTVNATPRGFIPGSSSSMQLPVPTDTVEISNNITITPKDDPETAEKIKSLAQSLNDKKNDIDTRVQDALDKVGYKAGVNDTLKIDVDSNGKIIVSGIKDRTMAKQIEQELNKDKTLGKDIKDFRLERSIFSTALKKATGNSLEDLSRRKKTLEDDMQLRLTLATANTFRDEENAFNKEDLANFNDISILAEDDELMKMVKGFTEAGSIDYATDKPGLADPLGTIERTGRNIMFNVAYEFKEYNKSVRKDWAGDEEEIQKRLLHIEDFQMRLGPNGEITVEGKFAQDPESDQIGLKIIENQLEAAYIGDEFSPTDSPLKTAMERFFELHEDNFGDTDEFQHDLAFDIKNNGRSIQAYAYSPEAEAASTAEIDASTTKFLEANGISKADAEKLDFAVDDDGKIALTTPIDDEAFAEKVDALLKDLNSGLAKSTDKDGQTTGESDGSLLGNAVAEIAPHLKHVLSHRPGGGKLSVTTPDDNAKDENVKVKEKKELFDKNLSIMKGTLPGTRSYYKPGIVRSLERMA